MSLLIRRRLAQGVLKDYISSKSNITPISLKSKLKNTVTSTCLRTGKITTMQYQYLTSTVSLEELAIEFVCRPVSRKRRRYWKLCIQMDDFANPETNEYVVYDLVFQGEIQPLIYGELCRLVYDECLTLSVTSLDCYGLFGFIKSGNVIYSKICSIF